jgi:hypothetical protein
LLGRRLDPMGWGEQTFLPGWRYKLMWLALKLNIA